MNVHTRQIHLIVNHQQLSVTQERVERLLLQRVRGGEEVQHIRTVNAGDEGLSDRLLNGFGLQKSQRLSLGQAARNRSQGMIQPMEIEQMGQRDGFEGGGVNEESGHETEGRGRGVEEAPAKAGQQRGEDGEDAEGDEIRWVDAAMSGGLHRLQQRKHIGGRRGDEEEEEVEVEGGVFMRD